MAAALMRSPVVVLLLAWSAALAPRFASADGPARSSPQTRAPQMASVAVLERGFDAGGEFCSDFNLTSVQTRWFFRRARIMGADTLYERFNELPCWVRGKARVRGSTWQWEVRAGGTASLTQPDGTVRLLGCKSCDAVLGGSAMQRKP